MARARRLDAGARHRAHVALSASKRAESGYVLALLGIMRRVHATVLQAVRPELPAPETRHDALDDRFLRRLFVLQRRPVQLAFDFMAEAVNRKATKAGAVVGIKPRTIAGLGGVIVTAREKNVRLIQGATSDFLAQVRQVLEDTEGEHVSSIEKALRERVDVSKSRATLIARTETLKLNSNIAQHRQRAAGVTQYTWSTSHDERVRPSHRELDGEVFSWDDPPETNDDGDRNHPGEDYNCRCVPIPYLAELDEEGAETAEEETTPLSAAAE